jgi:type I restriction enzyme S subunit
VSNVADFDTITIEEATDRLIDYRGKTPPKTDSGVRLITAKVVKGGQILEEPAEFIAEDFYDEWMRRGLPQKLDVLLTTEAPLGELAILRGSERIALAQRIILLRAKPGHVDPVFLFYALQSDFGQGELKARGSGTTVLGIKQSELRKVRIPIFPLPVQRRIAGILSAYDELMENSQRRIRLLEAMARALYREWFVHFRFPGHEKLPRVASPLGDIPQGWEVRTIADVCESVSYGYTASASREEVGPKFLRITDIVPATIDWAGVPFCEIPEDKAPKYLLKPGDIVVARTGATTGYAKRLNKLHPDTVFASYLVRARAKPSVSNRMLGIVMESDEYKQYIQTNIGGAAQPQANAVVLTSMRLAVPPGVRWREVRPTRRADD